MSFTACKPEAAEQRRKPQPIKTVYARGSMEWLASRRNRAEPKCRLRRRLPSRQRAAGGPTTKLAVAVDRGFESTSLQRRVRCEPHLPG
jgi:hypothetical protein